MTEEQLTVRYMRGWISLAEYRAELVRLYDREDAKEANREPMGGPHYGRSLLALLAKLGQAT